MLEFKQTASSCMPSINPVPPEAPCAVSTMSSTTTSTSIATPQNLWSDALETLSEDERQAVQNINSEKPAQQTFVLDVEELVRLTRKKQKECEEKSYKFNFQGKKIILRDVAEKIVSWLNKFKDFGDIAVNFDPVHASLPWAGVRFLLQVAVVGHEQMGALFMSIEKITYLTTRCTIYEMLYNSGTTPEQVLHNLYEALIKLYATMLQLMALAHRLHTKHTVTRAMHALTNPSELSDLLAKCHDLEIRAEIEAQNCERVCNQQVDTKTHELLESLWKPILRTDKAVSSFMERLDDRERLEILDWMSNVPFGKHHDTVTEKRTKNTCEWLLNHSRYQEWHDTSSSTILWLHGTPGTGKTYLTSKVIEDIQTALISNPNHEGLAFFYCKRNEEPKRQEPLWVLRSFVRQLSTIAGDEYSMQKRLQQFYIQTRQKSSEPTIGDCKELLLAFINLYPKTTFILDALDECDAYKRGVLIEIFDYFVDNASRPVKIFISSRPDGDIKDRFKSSANIAIQATDNHNDISRFVENEITKHRRWRKMSANLQNEIIHTLQNHSQGMFQWAFLQIEQLLAQQQEKNIRYVLGKLPKDLEEAYCEIYQAMNDSERQIADRAFQWVMCSYTPLPTSVLLPAVCQDMEDDIIKSVDDLDESLLLEYCHNLLVIDPNRGVWIPSHLSVIEYFEKHRWNSAQANSLVASVCLTLLSSDLNYDQEDELEEDIVQSDSVEGPQQIDSENHSAQTDSPDQESRQSDPDEESLQSYSETHSAQTNPSNQESQQSDSDEESLQSYSETHSAQTYSPDESVFHSLRLYAAGNWMLHVQRSEAGVVDHRLSALLKRFLGSPTNSSPAYRSWVRMFRKRARNQEYWKSYFTWTHFDSDDFKPTSLASFAICAFGFYSILSPWWDDPWAEQSHENANCRSLLHLAVLANSIPICARLIDWGADVNENLDNKDFGREMGSLLAVAAYHDHEEVVQLLLESGADVNAQLKNEEYGSALVAAVRGMDDSMEVVQLLLKFGADVNARPRFGELGSVLAAAAFVGDEEVVQLLLKSGAEVNAQLQGGLFGSALEAAAYSGDEELVHILLKSGAKVNTQSKFGYYGSALAAAAYRGDKNVAQLLLDSGAEVNAELRVGNYGSALAAAAYRGDKNVVQLLLDSGAEVNAELRVGNYGSALAAAARWYENNEVVQLLLDSGAEVNAKLRVGDYGSALAAAAYSGDKNVVQLLLDSGAEVNAELRVGDYGSALAAAAGGYENNKEVVQLLLDSGAEVNAKLRVGYYGSALAAGGYENNKEVVQLLLDSGAQLGSGEDSD